METQADPTEPTMVGRRVPTLQMRRLRFPVAQVTHR